MEVQIPQAFKGLFQPHRYKAFYGGRGSAKSHSFACALALLGAQKPLRILCSREIQKSIKDSVKRLIDDKIKACGLEYFYESTDTEIRGKNGTLFLFAGLKSNVDSIKSMEGINIVWVEEANRVSQRSLDLLIPTIRAEDSEIWFSWNPENELDPVDMMFRGKASPPSSLIQNVSWRDNPWFTGVLKLEMDFDQANNPEKYVHVWEGGYMSVQEGAYYKHQIAKMIADERVSKIPYDSNAPVYVSFDLGISDDTSLWFYQFIGQSVHVIDFYESNGEPIAHYAKIMKEKPYVYESLILPHDARARDKGTGKTVDEILRGLGFNTTIAPSIAVSDGIDNVRSFLGRCWFDQEKCEEGLKHLRNYRENFDEKLHISRGPLHDLHSHAADSFRYAAVTTPKKSDNELEVAKAKAAYMQPTVIAPNNLNPHPGLTPKEFIEQQQSIRMYIGS